MAHTDKREINTRFTAKRVEARKRHNAANRKASRLRSMGVEINGTQIDPRRSLKTVGRYNRKQLEAYISRLNAFTSRGTQYVPTAQNYPADRSRWEEYKRLESLLRQKAQKQMSKVGKHKLPNGMLTVEERLRAMSPTFPSFMEFSATSPNKVPNLSSRDLQGPDALEKMIESVKRKLKRDYYPSLVKTGRDSARKMLNEIGQTGIADKLDSLTDKQFEILWTYSPFTANLNLNYQYARALTSRNVQAMDDAVLTDALDEAKELVEWVSTIK